MSFGIGLGGFVQGLTAGMNARDSMDERKRRKVLEQRQDEEYNREKAQRDQIDQIGISTKQEFDKQVADGTQKPDNYEAFWKDYALPKLKNTYLTQGNYDMADKLQAWGENADVKAGAKLSMSAMYKASMGDAEGALDDAIKAGQIKGYMDHGYELLGKTPIIDPKTNQPVGFRLSVKTPQGDEVQQDIAAADIPRLVSTLINPQAAWDAHQQAQAEKAKNAQELDTYKQKKIIDQQYQYTDKPRSDAIESLRKRMAGGLSGDEPKFDDLPRDQQENLIQQEISLQRGQGSAPPAAAPGAAPGIGIGSGTPTASAPVQKVIVDKATGQTVNPAAVPGFAPAASRPAAPPQPPSAQAQAPSETPQERAQYLVQSAQDAISNGERASRIADELRQNGVPEEQWPENLNAALAKEKQNDPIGILGR